MFIKVSDDTFVNSDRVRKLCFSDMPGAELVFDSVVNLDEDTMRITEDAAHYFLMTIEAQDSFNAMAGEPPARPLISRLASMLRYEYPTGTTLKALYAAFPDEGPATIAATAAKLVHDHVVTLKDDGTLIHAANDIITPNPVPLIEDEARYLNSSADNERSIIRYMRGLWLKTWTRLTS